MRKYAIFSLSAGFLASVCMMVWMLFHPVEYVYLSAPLVSILVSAIPWFLLRKERVMILELTKGEIFELMVSALGGFLLLCKWMKSTNMRKVREYLEKQPLDGLSDCSCLGDFMKRSSCKKLFNYYFYIGLSPFLIICCRLFFCSFFLLMHFICITIFLLMDLKYSRKLVFRCSKVY